MGPSCSSDGAASPLRKRCKRGRSVTRASRRPRLRMTFCLTCPFSRTDSTTRTYSCTTPEELGTLTERINMMKNYHHEYPGPCQPNLSIISLIKPDPPGSLSLRFFG